MSDTRVLVGIMFSGENEYELCLGALKEQRHRAWDHFVLENLPNKAAHDALYQRFMDEAANYELFCKLDADMVFRGAEGLGQIVQIFDATPNLDQLMVDVHDWCSGLQIPGQLNYSSVVRWKHNPDPLLVDHAPEMQGESLRLSREPAPLADHSPCPAPLQAFQFGVHRALKAFQPDRRHKDFSRALVHWRILTSIWSAYRAGGDIRRLYALMGVEHVLTNRITAFDASYKSPALATDFEQKILPQPRGVLESRLQADWDAVLLNDQRFLARFNSFDLSDGDL
jgi:hypothetical protein